MTSPKGAPEAPLFSPKRVNSCLKRRVSALETPHGRMAFPEIEGQDERASVSPLGVIHEVKTHPCQHSSFRWKIVAWLAHGDPVPKVEKIRRAKAALHRTWANHTPGLLFPCPLFSSVGLGVSISPSKRFLGFSQICKRTAQ